jgi:predicted TIM-barrel fold metal-dependent hydrolase
MAKAGFKIIDAEPHFLEPHDLWKRNLPEPWRTKTTVNSLDEGKTGESGAEASVEGKEIPQRSGPRLVRERALRRVAAQPLLAKVTADPTPENFIEGFDVEGIDLGVMMPTVGMGIVRFDGLDPQHSLALCRVYNDFAADFVKSYPERLRFWAWLPPHDAAIAAEEARRCVEELGAAGVAMTGGAVDGNLLCDDFFDPLWAQLNDLGVAFGLHGPPPNLYLKDNIAHRYNGHPRTQLVSQVMGNPFHAQTELAELILGGVLHRFPNLKPVMMEVNASWLTWLLWRMDEKWESSRPDLPTLGIDLPLSPSEYFRRQCYAEIEPEEDVGKYVIDYIGSDNLLFSTDYPHSDSLFPSAVDTFLALPGISDADKRKILWDNPAKLFGIAD